MVIKKIKLCLKNINKCRAKLNILSKQKNNSDDYEDKYFLSDDFDDDLPLEKISKMWEEWS